MIVGRATPPFTARSMRSLAAVLPPPPPRPPRRASLAGHRRPTTQAMPSTPKLRSSGAPGLTSPRAGCTAPALDWAIEQGLQLAPWVPSLPKVAEALAAQRCKRVHTLVDRLLPKVAQLTPKIQAHDPNAIRDYDLLMDAAIQDLRHHQDGSWRDILVDIDNRTYHAGAELSDDPAMAMDARLAILDTLHRFNIATQSYTRWGDHLLPWLSPKADNAPVSIVDLAAGTGGFAVALKQRFGNRAQVTATDLVDDFLQLGAAQAKRTGTDVAFAHQDVLDLRPLRGQGIDVVTCTQSLHHFTPGQLGRMIGEALASAHRGLCFIDGERGALVCALVTLSMTAYGRDYPVVHDTFVSMRRMYVAEELELLARLAPGIRPEHTVQAGRLSPGHLILRVGQGTQDTQAKGKLP